MKRAILFICIAAVAGAALSLYLFRDRIFPAADFEINDELGGNIFPSLILSVATTDTLIVRSSDGNPALGNPKSHIYISITAPHPNARLQIEVAETPFFKRSVSEFVLPFNLVWVLWGLCALTIGYLLYLALQSRRSGYLLVAVFSLCSIGFLYSSDHVFNSVLEEHQQVRIKVLLGLEEDLSGAGYNVNQSKIAIGSGGLTGKGFLNGTQTKLKYVPEQDTDFIFCTVGEEEGFLGSAMVLLLFLVLILRLITLAERQPTTFGRVYGYSVLSIFLFHVFINIGMVLGLTPVIGIPLPFFSYGGSSLWGFSILLFIFLRIDAGRDARK